MKKEKCPMALMSQKALQKVWDNEEDEIWKSYL
jgi:hypothetical protein